MCKPYFYYYYISSSADQALDLRVGGPCNIACFLLYEMSRISESIKIESMLVAAARALEKWKQE